MAELGTRLPREASDDPWPMTYCGRTIDEGSEPGLVSVIIPTYNRAAILLEALESVWQQDYRPIEVVVADDGSEDDTEAVVRDWASSHTNDGRFAVRYVYQENAGHSAARSLGTIESRGEYIQFLDSDDMLYPERFGILVGLADRTPGFQVAVTNILTVDEKMRPIRLGRQPDITSEDRVARALWFSMAPPAPLYHRDFVRQVGFFRADLRLGEEWEYGIRVALRCDPARCIFVERPLAYWRMHRGPRLLDILDDKRAAEALGPAVHAALRHRALAAAHYGVCTLKLVQSFAVRQAITPSTFGRRFGSRVARA